MIKGLAYILAVLCFCSNAFAQVEFENKDIKLKSITTTGFIDYPPFGQTDKIPSKNSWIRRFDYVKNGMIMDYFQKKLREHFFDARDITVVTNGKFDNYDDAVVSVRRGKIDLLYGAYSQTKKYEGIEIVYPSIISNPITIIMLPSKMKEVKNLEDLKKLKGAINKHEHLNDFVADKIKAFNLKEVDSSEKIFEMLFTGKIDYIFSGYYFGIIEASKLGLRNKVSFSKQAVWNMPLFIGISKDSKHREALVHIIEKISNDPGAKQDIENLLRKTIGDIERKNAGVVPPAYSLETVE